MQFSLLSGVTNVRIQNNILWVTDGYAISVPSSSQQGFQSDYNLFYLASDEANIVQWEGLDFASIFDWSLELGFDENSKSADPEFVNPAGVDGVLGYSSDFVGAAYIVDNNDAGFSQTGTWTLQEGSGYAGNYLAARQPPGRTWQPGRLAG